MRRHPRVSTGALGLGLVLAFATSARAVCPLVPLVAEARLAELDAQTFTGPGRLHRPQASAGFLAARLELEPLTRTPTLVTWNARLRLEKTDGSFFVGAGLLGARPRPPAPSWEVFANLQIETGAQGAYAVSGTWDRSAREMRIVLQGQICAFPYPDTIFTGNVLQLRPGAALAEALAVQGEKIIAVGTAAQVLALRRPATRVVALGARALAPGFVDAHSHFLNSARVHGGAYGEVQDRMLSQGVTAVGEMFASELTVAAVEALDAAGGLRVRASLYPVFRNNCHEDLGEWYLAAGPRSDPHLRLRIPGVKFYLDGPGCEDPTYFAPATSFPQLDWDTSPPYGDLHYGEQELRDLVERAQAAGFQVALHAVGDEAQEMALDAIAWLTAGAGNPLHHRTEHNTILRPDQLARIGQLGSVPVVFGAMRTCEERADGSEPDSWAYSLAPADLLHYYRPLRDLLQQTPLLVAAWHADASYNQMEKLDTTLHLWQFVTRRALAADGTVCEPDPHLAAQTVTAEQALRAMTYGGAYALQLDRVTGRLLPGLYADLALLSGDPLVVPPDQLRDLEVQATIVAGELAYCQPGSNPLCP